MKWGDLSFVLSDTFFEVLFDDDVFFLVFLELKLKLDYLFLEFQELSCIF